MLDLLFALEGAWIGYGNYAEVGFGKHEGKSFNDVPHSYRQWVFEQERSTTNARFPFRDFQNWLLAEPADCITRWEEGGDGELLNPNL